MRYLAAIAAAIALLAFAAGCGGGDGGSSGDGTNAGAGGDATAAANEACAKANREVASLPIPDNEHAVVEYMEATEATVEQLHREVAALDGSTGIDEYAEALAASVAVLNEMANSARSRNPDGVRELSKQLEEIHLGEVAAAAGLDTCAEAPKVES